MRNALAHATRSGKRMISAFIGTAFAQEDATSVKAEWRRAADQLRPKVNKFTDLLDEAKEDVLAYLRQSEERRGASRRDAATAYRQT